MTEQELKDIEMYLEWEDLSTYTAHKLIAEIRRLQAEIGLAIKHSVELQTELECRGSLLAANRSAYADLDKRTTDKISSLKEIIRREFVDYGVQENLSLSDRISSIDRNEKRWLTSELKKEVDNIVEGK
jgi:hypothetical protein